MQDKELLLNRELTDLAWKQQDTNKALWKLEDFEADCQSLAQMHQRFLVDILQTSSEESRHYFSDMEEEARELHQQNFQVIENEREALNRARKNLEDREEQLLYERKQLASEKEAAADES